MHSFIKIKDKYINLDKVEEIYYDDGNKDNGNYPAIVFKFHENNKRVISFPYNNYERHIAIEEVIFAMKQIEEALRRSPSFIHHYGTFVPIIDMKKSSTQPPPIPITT